MHTGIKKSEYTKNVIKKKKKKHKHRVKLVSLLNGRERKHALKNKAKANTQPQKTCFKDFHIGANTIKEHTSQLKIN